MSEAEQSVNRRYVFRALAVLCLWILLVPRFMADKYTIFSALGGFRSIDLSDALFAMCSSVNYLVCGFVFAIVISVLLRVRFCHSHIGVLRGVASLCVPWNRNSEKIEPTQRTIRRKKPKKPIDLWIVLSMLFAALGAACFRLGVTLNGLDFGLLLFYANTQKGADTNYSAVLSNIGQCVCWALVALTVIGILFIVGNAVHGRQARRQVFGTGNRDETRGFSWRTYEKVVFALCAVWFAGGLVYLAMCIQLPGYVVDMWQNSSLIKDEYVDSADSDIAFPDGTRNLIWICMESGEQTCMDKSCGGEWDYNLIPQLTALSQQNVSFSDFISAYGTSWTVAGLVSQSCGLPLILPIDGNSYGENETFLPGAHTLGDILKEKGYSQVFMCGSDAAFGGRSAYFTQHGGYELWDYNTALETGAIPADYCVYWGFEDEKLFAFAKERILELDAQENPFSFTVLTVDTHFYDGYVCPLCGNTYDTQYENVIACADAQIADFVKWIQAQPFYENTAIVITGDHLCMDYEFYNARGIDAQERRIFNCFINAAGGTEGFTEDREFTSMDVFPTILTAMGAEWEGNRLGLGVDLFSGEATLVERIGVDALNSELTKASNFYRNTFLYGRGVS